MGRKKAKSVAETLAELPPDPAAIAAGLALWRVRGRHDEGWAYRQGRHVGRVAFWLMRTGLLPPEMRPKVTGAYEDNGRAAPYKPPLEPGGGNIQQVSGVTSSASGTEDPSPWFQLVVRAYEEWGEPPESLS